jgi:hypothetical protein
MDHYEVRKWGAWHRYVTLCLLAHAFLVVTSLATRNEEVARKKSSVKKEFRVRPDPADSAGGKERSARHGRAGRREEGLLARVVGMQTGAPSTRPPLPEGQSDRQPALSGEAAVKNRAACRDSLHRGTTAHRRRVGDGRASLAAQAASGTPLQ